MKQWLCIICGFIYDEALGLPEEGIAAGTLWADVPEDWKCPECGVGKADFEMIEIDDTVSIPAVVVLAEVPSADVGTVVVIGAGHAGFAAAEAVRKQHPNLPVLLLSEDAGDRYSKPRLSVCVSMTIPPSALVLEPASAVAARLGIEVRPNVRVHRIDTAAKVLVTSAGPITYGRLILATGAEPIRLPWFDDEVLSINHLADLERLASRLQQRRRVAIIGSGLIGCELANDLTRAGHEVTVLTNGPYPMDRLVPQPVGEALQQALQAKGVQWRTGVTVASHSRSGAADGLVLGDGELIQADVVIAAIGLRPSLELPRAAGLACAQGIVVDHDCRSSEPHVFALGDVAQYPEGLQQFIAPIHHGAKQLAAALLADGPTQVAPMPPMPVIAKTPDCPMAVLAPRCEGGGWQVSVENGSTVARWHGADGALAGFAIAGPAADDLKPWLAQVRS